jgi:hydrogenase maturation protease
MKNILIIGYGNTLRSDDGVGYHIAELCEDIYTSSSSLQYFIKCLTLHQLIPELAESISQSDLVIFIDAYPTNDRENDLKVNNITLSAEALANATMPTSALGLHNNDPVSLLNLSQYLYENSPTAWSILVPAINFDFGEVFSELTERAIAPALEQINQLINQAN